MQRGTTLEITLTGANLADPTGVWTSFPAKVTIPTDAKNGKDKLSDEEIDKLFAAKKK